jgi:hypothetical protein
VSGALRLRAVSAPWWNGVEFLLAERDGEHFAVGNVVMTDANPNHVTQPTFRLDLDNAQVLMDDLWACGVRPSRDVHNPGELQATQAHLKDMQQLTWKLLAKALGEGA